MASVEHEVGDTAAVKVAIPCDMGSDDVCISHFGDTSCCMLISVISLEPDITPN